MTNDVNEKNLKCFEWKVTMPQKRNPAMPAVSYYDTKNASFFFKQRKFNLKYCCNSGVATIYLESDKNFSYSMKIILHVTNTENYEHSKTFNVVGGSQEMWRYNYANAYEIPFTCEIIFKNDFLKETETTSENVGSKGNIPSYLGENIHFQDLSNDFSKLLIEDGSSDVTIICEGKEFQAHKVILKSRSTVLSAMLKCDMVEGTTGLITVKDIKIQIFEHFLRYLYSGKLPQLSISTAKELYKVADQYAVDGLKKACSEFMTKNLSETNACEILVLADLHSDVDFKKRVISYMVEKSIPQSSNWPEFCTSHCILAVEVLNLYIEKRGF